MSNLARRVAVIPDKDYMAVTDTPIDFSVPYKSRQKGSSRHFGFFPFFAKKPWPVVQEYIKHYTAPGDLVCDPFTGSGVTPVESLVLGRRAIASDINPVARFITRMTAVAPVDLNALQIAYEQVRAAAQSPIEALDRMSEDEIAGLLRSLVYPRTPIPVTVRRAGAETIDQLHTPRQLAGLTILRSAISQVQDDVLRDLLRVALANTVRYANKMYILPSDKGKQRSPYRGDAGFLRRSSYSLASTERFHELPIWQTFVRTYKNVLDAKEETNRIIGYQYSSENFVLAEVPASRIHEITGEGTVDYCFTDPPYSNDIHFVDLSTLWAAWLDFDISPETRSAELMIDPKQGKTRHLFEQEFAASVESIARSLKNDRWFTLVYKHRDLSLWQTIVAACEASNLRYVNSVWQDVTIKSTRQVESPNINPKGDMYLNFRKMNRKVFEGIYGQYEMAAIPTRPNYVEHEVERVIVSYLGADIETIASSVIQQILDSRSLRDYSDNPNELTEDIEKILKSPKFSVWRTPDANTHWVISSQMILDSSLPLVDRARYHIFDLLRLKEVAVEGEINRHVLTQLADERSSEAVHLDISSLLHSVATEIEPHRWQFDAKKVTDYKQLRLFFWPSKADELRTTIEKQHSFQAGPPLRLDLEGITTLRNRLREANTQNKKFEIQYNRLQEILKTILWRIKSNFEDQVEQVLAVGDWSTEGIDLRNLPFDDIRIHIVLRSDNRPFELYQQIAEDVFADLDDDDIFFQFQLDKLSSWRRSLEIARQQESELGISLLARLW
jgi:hypothetical protein